MKSVQLTDSCQRYLNEVSATSGLEIVYADYNNTIHQLPSSGGDCNLEVRQSCSRALKAFSRIRGNAQKKNYAKDAYCSDAFTASSWQWRLGSLYFPQQPVQARNIDSWKKPSIIARSTDEVIEAAHYSDIPLGDMYLSNESETYLQTLETFGKSDPHGHRSYASLGFFRGKHFVGEPGFMWLDESNVGDTVTGGESADLQPQYGPKSVDPRHRTAILTYLSQAAKTAKSLQYTETDPRIFFIAALFSSVNPDKPYNYFVYNSTEYKDAVAKGDYPFNRQNQFSNLPLTELKKYFEEIENSAIVTQFNVKEMAAFKSLPVTKKTKVDYSKPLVLRDLPTTRVVITGTPLGSGQHNFDSIGSNAIIPVNLERSTMFNLSGVPINNSRVLSLNLTLDTKVGSVYQLEDGSGGIIEQTVHIPLNEKYDHTADIFLQYVKLARVFLNNVEIEQ